MIPNEEDRMRLGDVKSSERVNGVGVEETCKDETKEI